MHDIYIMSVPWVLYNFNSHLWQQIHRTCIHIHVKQGNRTQQNSQANSSTSRYSILSHEVGLCTVVCMYSHCVCLVCVCLVHVCVCAEWMVYGLKHVHDSVKALPPTLSSVCKNTGHHIVNMSAFVTTTLSQSNNHKTFIQTPTWQTKRALTATKACQMWCQSLWQK